jgi:hypothetical protein
MRVKSERSGGRSPQTGYRWMTKNLPVRHLIVLRKVERNSRRMSALGPLPAVNSESRLSAILVLPDQQLLAHSNRDSAEVGQKNRLPRCRRLQHAPDPVVKVQTQRAIATM